jgi:glycolate oxidase iron-sulfur subunit
MAMQADEEARFLDGFSEYAQTLHCVHCGLCLSACPTYVLTGREADSPRGRILLMRGFAEGKLRMTPEASKHLSRCILCRACETTCPSGIQMTDMIEAFRQGQPRKRGLLEPGGLLGRWLLRRVIPHRRRLAAITDLLYVYQQTGLRRVVKALGGRFWPKLAALDGLQPEIPAPALRRIETDTARPEGFHARGKARMRVGLFLGCVASEWFAGVHHATIRVLQRNGCHVVVPDAQTCCGALHRHAGLVQEADALLRQNALAFSEAGVDVVVVNAAGCGASLRAPPARSAARMEVPVRDICEFLDEIGIVPPPGRIARTVACHQPCQLIHGQKTGPGAVERLLGAIPGIRLVPLPHNDRCCGSGAAYSIVHPEISTLLVREKAGWIRAAGAEVLVTGDPGCLLQIRAGLASAGVPVETLHPVELLDRSYGLNPRSSFI